MSELSRSNDVDTIAKLVTDDFIRSPPNLADTEKSQFIDAIRSGKQKYVFIKKIQMKYRVYGDTVLVNTLNRSSIKVDGKEIGGLNRVLFVWVKHNGRWLLAAVQGNIAPAP